MKNGLLLLLVLLAACSAKSPESAGTAAPTVDSEAGWTGRTHVEGVIEARGELMEHIEGLMLPIDESTIKPVTDPELLRHNAGLISAMLHAVPHLFPPTTNLYDPANVTPKTLALPAIWEHFEDFYAAAETAITAAEELAQTTDISKLPAASAKLRNGCDGCHALYLRKYQPPVTQPSDYEFDFKSALP